MTSLAVISLDLIQPHPRNVRRDATPDDELVASIRAQGILQPLGVVPTDKADAYLLIAGHRRYAAARAADLTTVPVVVLEHLDTETKQLEAMLVENGRRQDLTAMEEANAYEQLTLLGSDVDAIADATGRAKKTVRSRLKLTKLSEAGQEALHGHQITIDQAEQLAALSSYPAMLKKAEKALGTHQFGWTIGDLTRKRETVDRHRQTREEYRKRGLPEIKKPKGGWDWNAGPSEARQGETPDAWYPGTDAGSYDSGPLLIVTKREGRDDRAARDAELAERRARQQEEREARAVADRLRVQHVASLAPQLKVLSKPLLGHLQAAAAHLVGQLGTDQLAAVIEATGVKITTDDDTWNTPLIEGQILELPGTQVLKVLLAVLEIEAQDLAALHWRYEDESRSNAAAYWATFPASGYDLPDIDVARLAELDSPAEQAS